VDDSKAASKALHTELSMDPNDFEEVDVRHESTVTFCLKEFKAILSFCEASGQPVTIYFERGGRYCSFVALHL
jgi:cell cycle checkpoint control protein RAD9A